MHKTDTTTDQRGVFLLLRNRNKEAMNASVKMNNSMLKDKKKIKLRVYDSNHVPLEIIFKQSDRKGQEHEFLFAVFRPVVSGHSYCIEQGYHTDMKRIKQYLYHKYIK